MPTAEDIIHQQELLTQYRRTLHHLLRQQAALGRDYAPPGVANGIDEARADIQRCGEHQQFYYAVYQWSTEESSGDPVVLREHLRWW